MGINGLLKGLKPFTSKRSVRDFSGQSIAVDASSWFHKSVYSISERYVESMEANYGRLDPKCVQTSTRYVIGRCEELLTHAGIARIYLVLDGKRCPLKAQTNQDREDRRTKNLADARRYKRAGRRDKAEEKYKACIKIKSHFARAVADAVMKRFARDDRVQCVFSPYEADAQLVKLCLSGLSNAIVTEDSDVLVYLASCHCSYPILFKLERDTGACDVVTMDWLLSPDTSSSLLQQPGQQQQQQQASAGGALESVLRSLASRELRRPGVGARLFVQACVLAGCDYAPSRLNGVGLVTAFKLVRDNAHRPSTERFRHLLSSLSKKARGKENMVEYEDMLAKSEAVFYYHPVLQLDDGQVIPLTVPLTVEPEADNDGEDDHQLVSDRRPCMERFGTDWDFLGVMGEDQKNESIFPVDDSVPPVPEIVFPVKKKSSKRAPLPPVQPVEDAGLDEVNEIVNIVNPYARSRKQDDRRPPLSKVDSNNHKKSNQQGRNPFAHFGLGTQERQPKRKGPGMEVYLQNRQDVRFVKRKFSRDGSSSGPTPFVNAVRQRHQTEEARLPPQGPPDVAYAYPTEEQEKADIYHADDGSDGYEQEYSYLQQAAPGYEQPVLYDDTDPAAYPGPSSHVNDRGQFVYELDSFDEDGVESKYFSSARRITLEEPPVDDDISDARHPTSFAFVADENPSDYRYAAPEQRLPAQYSSTYANEGSVFSNDFIEDIEPSPAPVNNARPPFQDNGGWISTNKPSSRTGSFPPPSKRASSIKEAFTLQRMRASTYSGVEDIESPPMSGSARRSQSKQKSICDYFGKSPTPQNPFLYS